MRFEYIIVSDGDYRPERLTLVNAYRDSSIGPVGIQPPTFIACRTSWRREQPQDRASIACRGSFWRFVQRVLSVFRGRNKVIIVKVAGLGAGAGCRPKVLRTRTSPRAGGLRQGFPTEEPHLRRTLEIVDQNVRADQKNPQRKDDETPLNVVAAE